MSASLLIGQDFVLIFVGSCASVGSGLDDPLTGRALRPHRPQQGIASPPGDSGLSKEGVTSPPQALGLCWSGKASQRPGPIGSPDKGRVIKQKSHKCHCILLGVLPALEDQLFLVYGQLSQDCCCSP